MRYEEIVYKVALITGRSKALDLGLQKLLLRHVLR